jgi:hypothetical protein
VDPGLKYTVAELIFAAIIMLAFVAWDGFQSKKKRGPWK